MVIRPHDYITPMPLVPLPNQREAIEAPLGPVLVVAGPGAGKTFCLIGRVNHLISRMNFTPDRICAVTFTNKAAEEITVRLKESLGHAAEDITRGTLHALCVEILRQHGRAVGLPRAFGIADEDYQRQVLRHLGIRRARIGQLLTLFGRRRLQGHELSQGDEVLFRRYVSELRGQNMLDFDDLIEATARLFDEHPAVTAEVGARWDYVLVDEFQDLNSAQFEVLRHLAVSHRNFFAVGDDEQSIFSWTGADPEVLQRFAREYGIERPIVLDENRRCSKQIFEAARRLLQFNPSLFDKDLRCDRASVFDVLAYAFEDEIAEGTWLIDDLVADRNTGERSWGDYAILYRKHRVGTHVERALIRAGVPCRLARGRSLQDDPVISFVVASLRVMTSPDDPRAVEAFAEQLLPESLYEQVRTSCDSGEIEFLTAMRIFAQTHPKDHPDTKKAWRFVYHVENLKAMRNSHDSLSGLVGELLAQRVGKYRNVLEEHYERLSDPEDDAAAVALSERLEHIRRRGGRILLEPGGGVEIALRGMLFESGFPAVQYADWDVEPEERDLVLREEDAGSLGLSPTVFKALQLLGSRDFDDVFRDYVAFDLETTDKDIDECDVVEIGAVRVRGGELVDRFRELVRPRRPVSSRAQEVHGYGDADLRDAPFFEEVWPRFRAFVGDDLLVAHNGQRFDVPVLRRAAAGLSGVEDLVFYDTLPLARSLCRDSARLEDLAARFGIDTGRSHHALDDAIVLAEVFAALGAQKIVRARKSAAVNRLDYLGLAIALESRTDTDEARLLFELARPFALGRFSDCLQYYENERSRLGTRRVPPVEDVIERLGGARLMERLRTKPDPARRYPQAMGRLDTLIEASSGETLDDHVQSFLERVVLSTSQGAEVDPHRVNLLTLHSTKGLEFSRVYIVGVEDFELPGYYPMVDNRVHEIEEARRLLYVGMTRAEDRLVLTRANRRFGDATGGTRFLDEIGITEEDDRRRTRTT